jgi:hypothetical protein
MPLGSAYNTKGQRPMSFPNVNEFYTPKEGVHNIIPNPVASSIFRRKNTTFVQRQWS